MNFSGIRQIGPIVYWIHVYLASGHSDESNKKFSRFLGPLENMRIWENFQTLSVINSNMFPRRW